MSPRRLTRRRWRGWFTRSRGRRSGSSSRRRPGSERRRSCGRRSWRPGIHGDGSPRCAARSTGRSCSPSWPDAWESESARMPIDSDRGRRWSGPFAWRRFKSYHLVLAVDDCHETNTASARRDLDFLHHLGSDSGTDLDDHPGRSRRHNARVGSIDAWTLAIVLKPLTRTQVDGYLRAKLDAAGCVEAVFTPRAITRMHHLSAGIPRGLDRLASLCLVAGAVRGLEVITPDVVDGAARECRGADPGPWPPGQAEPTRCLA